MGTLFSKDQHTSLQIIFFRINGVREVHPEVLAIGNAFELEDQQQRDDHESPSAMRAYALLFEGRSKRFLCM